MSRLLFNTLDNTGERLIPDTEDSSLNHQVHMSRYEFAATVMAPDAWIADVGCGTGYGIDYLARRTSGKCVGIDKLESIAYAQARYQVGNLDYTAADVTRPFMARGQFDLVVSFDVIEHVDDIPAYLHTISGLLRDERSTALISTPWSYRANNFMPLHNPYHTCELTLGEFYSLLEPHFFVESVTLAMGMMAILRTKRAEPQKLDILTIPLSGQHIVAMENAIEALSCRVEAQTSQLAMLDEVVEETALNRRLRLRRARSNDRSLGDCSIRAHAIKAGAQYTGNFRCDVPNLSALELLLTNRGRPLAGHLELEIRESGQTLRMVKLPALLVRSARPLRFVFDPIPDSAGRHFSFVLTRQNTSGQSTASVFCSRNGTPLYQVFYRRYSWQGNPSYVHDTVWLCAQSTFPAGIRSATGQEPQTASPSGATLMQKFQRSISQDGVRTTICEIWSYLRWRLRRKRT